MGVSTFRCCGVVGDDAQTNTTHTSKQYTLKTKLLAEFPSQYRVRNWASKKHGSSPTIRFMFFKVSSIDTCNF